MRLTQIRLLALIVLSTVTLRAADVPENVMAVVKFPPPKTFTEKVMSIARVVQPGQQTEMLPLFMLGSFGYPNYPGVSETDRVSVFLFDSDAPGAAPFVILAKVAPDSTLRQSLASFQWAMEDRDGWLLLSNNSANFNYIQDLGPYLAMNAEEGNFDVEVRLFLGAEKIKTWSDSLKTMLEQRHTAATGGDHETIDIIKKTRFVDFAAMGAENLNWVEMGLDLSAQTITFGTIVDAIAGTPEGQLLSSQSKGEVPVAEYVTDLGVMSYISDVSIEAWGTYYDVLDKRAQGFVGENGKAWLASMSEVMHSYLKMSDGTTAGSFTSQGDAQVDDTRILSVGGGSYSDAEVVEISQTVYDSLLPKFFEAVPFFQNQGMTYDFDFEPKAGKIGEVAVHKITTTFKMDPPKGEDGQELPKQLTDNFNQEQIYYFAVVNGNMLNTSTMEDMTTLVAAVQAGEPVEGNISKTVSLNSGDAMAYTMDIAKYFSMGLATLPSDAPMAKEMNAIVEEMKKVNLKPATGAVQMGDNRLRGTFSVPVMTLAKIAQGFQKMQAQQAMQDDTYNTEGEGDAAASDGSSQ